MKFLVLCHPDDITALAVAAELRRRHGKGAVGVISAEALAMAPVWRHSLAGEADSKRLRIDSSFRLAGGLEIDDSEIQVVFNRFRHAVAPHFQAATVTDQDYASFELNALWVSWLAGLGAKGIQVINPPQRGALQPGYTRLEWLKMAAAAGFGVARFHVNSREELELPARTAWRLLSAGRHLVALGPANAIDPDRLRNAVERLQATSGCSFFELGFDMSDGEASVGLILETVDAFPQLDEVRAFQAAAEMLAGAVE